MAEKISTTKENDPSSKADAAMVSTERLAFSILIAGLLVFLVLSAFVVGPSSVQIYAHFRSQLGPVFPVLAGLSLLLMFAVFHPLIDRKTCLFSYKALQFVEAAGPAIGLLGTVLALQNGFAGLNLSGGNVQEAINGIIKTIAVSLGTTGYGLILGLLAWAFGSWLMAILLGDEWTTGV